MQIICLTCAFFFLQLQKGASGEGLFECTNLSSTSYSFKHEEGRSVSLPCLRNCSGTAPSWYHASEKSSSLTALQDTSNTLELLCSSPPKESCVDYFCCACSKEDPHSCCFGVGYSPVVVNFRITQSGNIVTALHEGENFTINCEVYGYPELALEISGPIIGVFKKTDKSRNSSLWYSLFRTVETTNASVSDSGIYSCVGMINFTQNGRTAPELSDDIPQWNLTVYRRPSITGTAREPASPTSHVTFTCDVECSVYCNVTWQHNGTTVSTTAEGRYQQSSTGSQYKLIVELASPSDIGIYTCTVNTDYQTNETYRDISFFPGGVHSDIVSNHGPVEEGASSHFPGGCLAAAIVALVGFVSVAVIVLLVVAKLLAPRHGVPVRGEPEPDHVELVPQESGEEVVELVPQDSGEEVARDGLRHRNTQDSAL